MTEAKDIFIERGDEEEDEEKKKKKGGSCGGNSNSGKSAAEYPAGTSPEDLGDVGLGSGGGGGGSGGGDTDATTNEMCKKVYTVYRARPKDYSCPTA